MRIACATLLLLVVGCAGDLPPEADPAPARDTASLSSAKPTLAVRTRPDGLREVSLMDQPPHVTAATLHPDGGVTQACTGGAVRTEPAAP